MSGQKLFKPVRLGRYELSHRVAMAPLTRSRAGQPGNVPTEDTRTYYAQRPSAALIITEGVQISQQGQGYAWTPGIHSNEQIEGWKKVSEEVKAKGGHIFMQLWHVGRVSHPVFQPNGRLPVGPSALPVPGKTFIVDDQGNGVWGDIPVPRQLTVEEIADVIADYRAAARNAITAGMDGIEIHSGNGYQRSDVYGGSSENRARLLLEVVDAVVAEVGADRVAVRLTPMGRFMGMDDDSPNETFGHIVASLNKHSLAYLHLVEPAVVGVEKDLNEDPRWDQIIKELRATWKGTLMLAGGYDAESAERAISSGRADLIAFGRQFIANPDLPRRIRERLPLNTPDATTFFGGDHRGYVDYPFHP